MAGTPRITLIFTLVLFFTFSMGLFLVFLEEGASWRSLPWTGIVALFLVALAAGFLEIRFPSEATFDFTADAAIALAIGIILGPFWGPILVMISTLILDLIMRREAFKLTVNVLNLGFSTLVAAVVYQVISSGNPSPFSNTESLVALVLASVVYATANTSILALIVSPVIGTSAIHMWLSNIRPFTVELVTLPSLGGIIPVLYLEHPLAPALFIVPLVGPFLAFRALRQVEEETRATIESLADALEQRDQYTHQHSIRVTGYAAAILDQIPHIPFEVRETILSAARIHDVGKVAISDIALNKPGKLNEDEWREIQRHAAIGGRIVEHLAIYREQATIVRNHHERWDGGGYPDGLKGDEIPFGSRVIAVADTFDAMTSDRAYRPGMSASVAMSIISRESGLQFDPQVVTALERALEQGANVIPRTEPASVAKQPWAADQATGVFTS
ncbi:MAG TPA: HD-GYP domain-containing protein [Thermomicrobiales bacterium]|nr:HD-GYP domain-containing protein [Thermomicrobiales bacterium]